MYKLLSVEEFLELPETKPASEYIDGQIIQKPMPKGRHSSLQSEICTAINQVAKREKIAYAFPEMRCTFGGRSIVPDVAVFQWQHIPYKVIGNILHCLRHGCQLGWFIDPDDRSVLTFLPGQQPELKQASDSLPVLEAILLEMTADRVFGWLKMETENS